MPKKEIDAAKAAPTLGEPRKNWLRVEVSNTGLDAVAEACGSKSKARERLEQALAEHLDKEIEAAKKGAIEDRLAEVEKERAQLRAALG